VTAMAGQAADAAVEIRIASIESPSTTRAV